jgi:hypothetical protein
MRCHFSRSLVSPSAQLGMQMDGGCGCRACAGSGGRCGGVTATGVVQAASSSIGASNSRAAGLFSGICLLPDLDGVVRPQLLSGGVLGLLLGRRGADALELDPQAPAVDHPADSEAGGQGGDV